VADEQVGEIVLGLQVAQEVDHLRLHAHVERRGRLVEHDEARVEHHRPRDRNALALPARKLVRIAEARLRIEPDLLQHVDHPPVAILGRQFRFVDLEAFLDDLGD
jgi:hypothetical protein